MLEDEQTTAGDKIAIQADRQERIPEALAKQMFDPKDNPNPVWEIAKTKTPITATMQPVCRHTL